MEIAIIEDDKVHSDVLISYIHQWSKMKEKPVTTRYYESAESFLFQWEDMKIDLAFLDIQMSGMNGVELAKKIRTQNSKMIIVFTTGISDYLEDGYEVEAMHYLIKPVKQDKVFQCLDKAFAKRPSKEYLVVHTQQDDTVKIDMEKINCIEAQKHMCLLHLIKESTIKESSISVKENLTELEKNLLGKEFIKCHRSYLCRLGNIHQIGKDAVIFDDKSEAPISRRMYQEVNKAFIHYYRRESETI